MIDDDNPFVHSTHSMQVNSVHELVPIASVVPVVPGVPVVPVVPMSSLELFEDGLGDGSREFVVMSTFNTFGSGC